MTRLKTLVERIRRRPSEAKFRDVQKVLEAYGWTHARTKGSHVTFTKVDEQRILTVTVHNKRVERVYLDKICVQLDLDIENEAE